MKIRSSVAATILGLVLPAAALAELSIGVYDSSLASLALNHLNSSHGLGAVYTTYDPVSFAAVTDFTDHAAWYVGSTNSGYGGLRANAAFQDGDRFARVVITGTDPDWHIVNAGDPKEGPSLLLKNALLWAAGGQRPGLVVQADAARPAFDWLPPSWGVTGAVTQHSADVIIAAGQAGHPLNAGLSNAKLSNWASSRHVKFDADLPGWTTVQRT